MNKRFVAIQLLHLVTDWHSRKQPHLKNYPFVLKAQSRNRTVVTAASVLAKKKGIYAGMMLADARAICPELQVLEDKPGLGEQLLQRMAEWCIRFTPITAPDIQDGLLLDATGCTHLWGSEEAYCNDIANRLANRGYSVRIAIADSIGAAWAMSRYGHQTIIAAGKNKEALENLPVAALRLDSEVLEHLQKLGLHRIQQLLSIPRMALRRRFGNNILLRLSQALGDVSEHIKPVHLAEPFEDWLPCLEPISTRMGIEIGLQKLLHQLCARLREEGKGIRKVFFRCYRTDGSTQALEVSTSSVTQNEAHLFQLFSLKLDTIAPGEGIDLFLLRAIVVEDCMPTQEALWQKTGGLQQAQLAQFIDRVEMRLGVGALQRYLPSEHWWPERSFRQATSLNEKKESEWMVPRPRPLYLLQPPEEVVVTAPVPDYPPLNFRYKGILHTIIKADGPERIEPEWWLQEGEHRDYYVVEDAEGHRFWLFRLGHYNEEQKPKWYVHGLFA